MSQELQIGDRVRVTVQGRRVGYEPGDKGTVLWEPSPSYTGQPFYLVSMDKDGPGNGITFTTGQIEADVGGKKRVNDDRR
ncbi:MAG TPA: hypothetical protein VH643_18685 [Gemmataceae bacterium]|jgi:hypothetical protein